MHPQRRLLFGAAVVLVLSFAGLIHAQVNTTGKVMAVEQLEKVGVLTDEHPAMREYYETLALERWDSFIDQPPVRFAREPWEPTSVAFERTLVRNPTVRANVRTPYVPGVGRERMEKKLNEIRIAEFHVPQALELSEVLRKLQALAREMDPERGINLVRTATPSFDIATGKTPASVEDYMVKITPPLRNKSLRDLLNTIVDPAVPPKGNEGAPRLQYSVQNYGVLFRQRAHDPLELIDAPLKVITQPQR